MTAKQIERALVDARISDEADPIRIHRGNGYVYVTGGETPKWYTTSILTSRLSDMTIDQWVAEIRWMASDENRSDR